MFVCEFGRISSNDGGYSWAIWAEIATTFLQPLSGPKESLFSRFLWSLDFLLIRVDTFSGNAPLRGAATDS